MGVIIGIMALMGSCGLTPSYGKWGLGLTGAIKNSSALENLDQRVKEEQAKIPQPPPPPAPNQIPVATIDSITPNHATFGDTVNFAGHGVDPDGTVVGYLWESGSNTLSQSANFATSALTIGTHNITFAVVDNLGSQSVGVSTQLVILPLPPNQAPTAVIDNIQPNIATVGTTVNFTGHGVDSDGIVTKYAWTSNISGTLSQSANFAISTLSVGTHNINFAVGDNLGSWSVGVSTQLVILPLPPNQVPTAVIDSILPNIATVGTTVNFTGHGVDTDGTVVGYLWESGSNTLSQNASFNISTLPVGTHTIKFAVRDNCGSWSVKVSGQVVIFTPPPPPPPNTPPSLITLTYPQDGYRGEQGYLGGDYNEWGWIPITGLESDGGTITMKWIGGDDPDGVVYYIYACVSDDFGHKYYPDYVAGTLTGILVGTTTSKEFPIWLQKWEAYKWRVVACDGRGSSTSSEVESFKNGNSEAWVELYYPIENSIVPLGSLTFTWHVIALLDGDPVRYGIQILDYENYPPLISIVFYQKGLPTVERTREITVPDGVLKANHAYTVNVWAKDGWGGSGGDLCNFITGN
ncbi:MAG: hypothetical protein V1649_02130 [Patescibacteria group bacterium]